MNKFTALVLASVSGVCATSAFAQTTAQSIDTMGGLPRPYFGLLTGAGILNKGLGTQVTVGAHGGARIHPKVDLGFYGTYQGLGAVSSANLASGVSVRAQLTTLALETNFYPFSEEYFYLGAKVGMGILTAERSEFYGYNSAYSWKTGVKFAVGPAGGLLFKVGADTKLGVEANWIVLPFAESDLSSVNILGNFMLSF